MTGPIADQQVNAHLGGVDPSSGQVLGYQAVPILARTIFSNYDGRQPFYTNYGKGNVANSAATYDAVTGASLQTATRHIDPYGNAAELHKVWTLLWYWLLDGAPTDMGPVGGSTNRISTYITLANQLRPWPVGFVGAAAGEPTQAYPAFPPGTPTPLDSFMAQTVTDDAARARSAFHDVPPVVRHPHPPVPPRPNPPRPHRDPPTWPPNTGPVGPEHVATGAVPRVQPVTLDELLHTLQAVITRLGEVEVRLGIQ